MCRIVKAVWRGRWRHATAAPLRASAGVAISVLTCQYSAKPFASVPYLNLRGGIQCCGLNLIRRGISASLQLNGSARGVAIGSSSAAAAGIGLA